MKRRKQPRDPRHHACVDRQAYHAIGALLLGWFASGLVDLLGGPFWVGAIVLVVLLVAVPVMELAWDSEERRRAALTEDDHAAGRW